jgi:hypothetical protein
LKDNGAEKTPLFPHFSLFPVHFHSYQQLRPILYPQFGVQLSGIFIRPLIAHPQNSADFL